MSETDKNIPINGWDAVMELGKQAENAGIQDMSLDEKCYHPGSEGL